MRKSMILALGACALALAACGGGSGTPKATSTPDPNARELEALSQKFGSASFEVHYGINATGGDQPLNGFVTIYKDGKDRTRFDVASNEAGEVVSLILLETPDANVFCLPDAGALAQIVGVEQGSGVCFKNDPTNAASDLTSITDSFAHISASDVKVTAKQTRTISGVSATCYDYTTDSGDTKNETCFTPEGVPLYDKSASGSDTTELDAVTLKPQPAASVFAVPYPVKDLPAESGG